MNGIEITASLRGLRVLVKTGKVEYNKALEIAQPLLDELNNKMEKIAKKHNRFFKKAVFTNF